MFFGCLVFTANGLEWVYRKIMRKIDMYNVTRIRRSPQQNVCDLFSIKLKTYSQVRSYKRNLRVTRERRETAILVLLLRPHVPHNNEVILYLFEAIVLKQGV